MNQYFMKICNNANSVGIIISVKFDAVKAKLWVTVLLFPPFLGKTYAVLPTI